MSMETYYKNYLSHHGIRGQKWGKKNGPPYPLSPGDHSASERKAGWRKSLDKDSNTDDTKEKFHLTDKQKKVLIAAGIATVAVVGGIALYKSGILNKDLEPRFGSAEDFIEKHKDFVFKSIPEEKFSQTKKAYVEKGKQIAEKSGLKMQDPYADGYSNIVLSNQNPSPNNCSHCVIAYTLRQMGLDVTAKPMEKEFEGGPITNFEFTRYFNFSKDRSSDFRNNPVVMPDLRSDTECKQYLSNEILKRNNNKNSMGIWSVQGPTGGHFMSWVINNGQVTFIDPQLGNYDNGNIFKYFAVNMVRSREINIARLDDLEVNYKQIKNAVE